MSRLRPPEGGTTPPAAETLSGGAVVELGPIARRVAERYFAEFPDDLERYGEAARAWCVHDTQYLLAWLIQDARLGAPIFERQLNWLAKLLDARGYPLARLERHLALLAEEVAAGVDDGERLARRVRAVRPVVD